MIFVRKQNGWLHISDTLGHRMRYLYYSERDAIRRFKEQFGYRYKRGIQTVRVS